MKNETKLSKLLEEVSYLLVEMEDIKRVEIKFLHKKTGWHTKRVEKIKK